MRPRLDGGVPAVNGFTPDARRAVDGWAGACAVTWRSGGRKRGGFWAAEASNYGHSHPHLFQETPNLYDLMDAAYDAEPIRQHSRSLGHVPLIDTNPRRDKTLAEELRTEARRLKHLGFQLAEQVRYNERTAGERVNGRLKDEFGGRHVRVRGAAKVMCHCMFGVLALTVDQLVRLVT